MSCPLENLNRRMKTGKTESSTMIGNQTVTENRHLKTKRRRSEERKQEENEARKKRSLRFEKLDGEVNGHKVTQGYTTNNKI